MYINTHSLSLSQMYVCSQIAQLERALASAEHALKTGANSQKHVYYTLPHSHFTHERLAPYFLYCTATVLQLHYRRLFTTHYYTFLHNFTLLHCNCTTGAYLLHCNCTAIVLQALIYYSLFTTLQLYCKCTACA